MNSDELEALGKLARSLSLTRAEIDGMRTVMLAAVATIHGNAALREAFAVHLRAAKEAELAHCLASPMSDEDVQSRLDWIRRLVPHELRALIE